MKITNSESGNPIPRRREKQPGTLYSESPERVMLRRCVLTIARAHVYMLLLVVFITSHAARAQTTLSGDHFVDGHLAVGTTGTNRTLTVSGTTVISEYLNVYGRSMFSDGHGSGALSIGADVNAYTRSNGVRKVGRIVMPGYTTGNANYFLFGGDFVASGSNNGYFGGMAGSSTYGLNRLSFNTVNGDQVIGGTERMAIDNLGQITIAGFDTSAVGIRVIGGSSQSGNLFNIDAFGESGGSLFSVTSSGDVGIGVSTPAAKLHVEGDIKLTGKIRVFTGTGTSASIVIDPDTASLSVGGQSVLVPNASGNIGLGTSSPTQQFQLTRNLSIAATANSGTGVIMSGGSRFLHTYGTENLFLGVGSGNFSMTGGGNVGLGVRALDAVTTGVGNFAIGNDVLGNLTTGGHNTGVGTLSLGALTTGSGNVAVGAEALRYTTTSWYNVAIGIYALSYFNSGHGTAIGFSAGQSTSGWAPTFIGYQAGKSISSGNYNTAIGWQTLYTDGTTASTNGDYRTAIGAGAQVTANNTIALGGTGDFAANTVLGGTSASAKLHVIKTTEQVRVGYDGSNYCSTTVNNAGEVTLNASGTNAGFVFSDVVKTNGGLIVSGTMRIGRQGDILMGEFGEEE